MAAVAVTGEPGAGKSTVARVMERMGATRFDADAVVHALWRRPDVVRAALARWGTSVLDDRGEIDRAAVGARIFSSPEDHRWCCALLHPLTMDELSRRVSSVAPPGWAVVEVPLLFEAGRPAWATRVVFVTAPWDERARRCREQRGWDEEELRRREAMFLPSRERMAMSDIVIENAGDAGELEARVRGALISMGLA